MRVRYFIASFLTFATIIGAALSWSGCGSEPCGGCQDSGNVETSVFYLTGQVRDETGMPLADATVYVTGVLGGNLGTTTDQAGAYGFEFNFVQSWRTAIAAADHVKLIEQQYEVQSDSRHDYIVPTVTAFKDLVAGLPSYDSTKAVVDVAFVRGPYCASTEGAVLVLQPTQPAMIVYLANGKPDLARAYAADGEHAILYNVDPKSEGTLKLRMTWAMPTDAGTDGEPGQPCGQVRYPIALPNEPGFLYDDFFNLEPGTTLTRATIFVN